MSEEKISAEKWIQRIRRAEQSNKDKRDEAIRFKRAYVGDFVSYRGNEVSKYTLRVNFIYTFVETVLATMFAGEPKVRGRPKKDPNLQKAAELLAYNTNYWAKEIDARSEFRDAVFDSFFGPAAIYTGWEYEVAVEKVKKPVPNPLTGEPIIGPDGQPVFQEVEEEKVLKDEPTIRWLNFWDDVRVDPDVMRTRRARWMAVRTTIPFKEFVEMENIKEEYRRGENAIKPTIRPEDMNTQDQSYLDDRRQNVSDAEWVSYWEVWDRESMQRYYIHEMCADGPINKDTSWPYEFEVKRDVFPITILHAKTDPFGPISFSEFKAIEDQIWERIRVRSVQAAIARRIAPKYLFQKGAGTKEQIKKLLTSDILSANELNDVGKFGLMPVPQIPEGFYQWDIQLQDDIGNASGLSEFEQGSLANTATEASIAEGRSNVRRQARAGALEDFVVTVLSKIAALCQQLQLRETTFMISPPELSEAEPQVFNISKDQIQGEFELELIPGSMEHVNEETEKRDLTRFLEVAINSPEVNQRELIKKLATLLGLDVGKVLLTDEEKQRISESQPKEPTLTFEKIKLEDMLPADRLRVIEAAKKENDVSSLSQGPKEAMMAAFANRQGGDMPNTSMPMNQSQNLAGNENPAVPVQPASLEPTR